MKAGDVSSIPGRSHFLWIAYGDIFRGCHPSTQASRASNLSMDHHVAGDWATFLWDLPCNHLAAIEETSLPVRPWWMMALKNCECLKEVSSSL